MKIMSVRDVPDKLTKGKVYEAEPLGIPSARSYRVLADNGTILSFADILFKEVNHLELLREKKAGDWVYHIIKGWLEVEEANVFLVAGGVSYLYGGKFQEGDLNPTIYPYDPIGGTIAPSREIDWAKVPVDTPVLVRATEEGEWKSRYFQSVVSCKTPLFICTPEGQKSYESEKIFSWEQCKLNCEPKEEWYATD